MADARTSPWRFSLPGSAAMATLAALALGPAARGQGYALWTFNGAPASSTGWAVAGLGDMNADGFDDVLVGAPQAGQARVFSGATGLPLFTLTGVAEFGVAVAGTGDADGDDIPDLIVGGPGTAADVARTFSGANGALLFDLAAPSGSGDFGRSVAGVGDVSGDGVPDVAVGAPRFAIGSGPGVARVVSPVGLPPRTSAFGAGCPGSSGEVPRITTGGGNPSVLVGNPNFRLVLSKALPNTISHLVLGVSDTVWVATGIPLPIDLAPFGLPGCPLLVSIDFLFLDATTADGIASVPMPVPAVPALAGASVYFQGRVFDSTGAITGGLEVVL
ncbi:MAG: integrin alpha [Planctomycetes bacterium]|nr:integrin alpha [Planctomycetota bacterium]